MDEIRGLARQYSSQSSDRSGIRDRIKQLYAEYVKHREESLLDAAAAAAGVSAVVMSEHFNPAELTPQMREAFELAYPHVSVDSLVDYTPDQLVAFVNG